MKSILASVIVSNLFFFNCFAEASSLRIPCDSLNCNDVNPCTLDNCVNEQCVFTSIICDDGNICTSDSCVNGICVYDSILNCFNSCDTLDCTDAISCTIDTCINGSCLNIPIVINLGNIEGPPCVAVNTTGTYRIDSLGPDYLYQWQVGGIGEFADSSEHFWETMVAWNDTGATTLSAVVFNRTCSDTAWLNIIVVESAECCPNPCPATLADEIEGIVSLQIIPNPNTGDFIVQMKGIIRERVEITVLNILGQNIYETSDNYSAENSTAIHLDNAANGIYLLQVKVGEKTFHQLVNVGSDNN